MALNYTIIGDRLKEARMNKKLTQEDLAEKLGVSVPYVSRIERGSTAINLKRLAEICNILLGGTPKTEMKEYWGGNIHWLNSGEIANFPVVT